MSAKKSKTFFKTLTAILVLLLFLSVQTAGRNLPIQE